MTYYGPRNDLQERHGLGEFIFRNPFFTYQGPFVGNYRHGSSGTLYFGSDDSSSSSRPSSSSSLVCNFSRGEISGRGVRRYADGSEYVGPFENGERHGSNGRFVKKGVGVFEGTWNLGQLSGLGRAEYENGDVYRGEFRGHKYHGQGVLRRRLSGGLVELSEGTFVEGRLRGLATLSVVQEDEESGIRIPTASYHGEFLDSVRSGEGVYSDHVQKIRYSGAWDSGVPLSLRDSVSLFVAVADENTKREDIGTGPFDPSKRIEIPTFRGGAMMTVHVALCRVVEEERIVERDSSPSSSGRRHASSDRIGDEGETVLVPALRRIGAEQGRPIRVLIRKFAQGAEAGVRRRRTVGQCWESVTEESVAEAAEFSLQLAEEFRQRDAEAASSENVESSDSGRASGRRRRRNQGGSGRRRGHGARRRESTQSSASASRTISRDASSLEALAIGRIGGEVDFDADVSDSAFVPVATMEIRLPAVTGLYEVIVMSGLKREHEGVSIAPCSAVVYVKK